LRAERARVRLVVADRLHRHGRGDPVGRLLDQLEDERAADAAADHLHPVDAEVVEHGQLILGVHAPGVGGVERPARLAAFRWSIAITRNWSPNASSGLSGIRPQNDTLEFSPPGAS